MFDTFLRKVRLIVTDGTLRDRVLFVLGALVVFRLLAAIPIPGINAGALENFLVNNQFLGLLNVFSGGGFFNLSIMMIGDSGRMRFTQYSRYLTVPLSFIQAFGFLILLRQNGIVPAMDFMQTLTNVMVIAAGAVLLMWIGELITEFGVGNGISLLIFAGIVSG